MALRHTQQLKLGQKLLPQQILLMKLLQLPTLALEERIKEELEANPALEEIKDEGADEEVYSNEETDEKEEQEIDENGDLKEEEFAPVEDDVEMEDYMDAEELDSYKYEVVNKGPDEEQREYVLAGNVGFRESLEQQLGVKELSEKQHAIGQYLIGCIDEDGYVRREAELVADDLAFNYNINATPAEVDEILGIIQTFDPPGIGARNLQECLLIQLERKPDKTREIVLAMEVIKEHMDEFSKKHYDKIMRRLDIGNDELKDVISEITHLNPRPGSSEMGRDSSPGSVVPDFIVTVNDGEPELSINGRNLPDLKISKDYEEMMKEYSKSREKSAREASGFIKSKIDSAAWFIEAIQQRYATLAICMKCILEYQHEYFVTGDESKLKPMILKDIATRVNMDLSTISRMANSKYVQTPYGTFPLKNLFSESMSTESGDEVSNREIKTALKELIDNEDKRHPLTDDELCARLNEKGYNIARRTVAKYREQMDLPVGRMRRQL